SQEASPNFWMTPFSENTTSEVTGASAGLRAASASRYFCIRSSRQALLQEVSASFSGASSMGVFAAGAAAPAAVAAADVGASVLEQAASKASRQHAVAIFRTVAFLVFKASPPRWVDSIFETG